MRTTSQYFDDTESFVCLNVAAYRLLLASKTGTQQCSCASCSRYDQSIQCNCYIRGGLSAGCEVMVEGSRAKKATLISKVVCESMGPFLLQSHLKMRN